ncbi:copper homeostasis protein cutC homolog isoform X1 [Xenia sp. Carnegie-2017]|uniref:copper homeostasis protein cutC homolog isoform X1 n=1 Tax=Xenia sp. Carnegie-2017 TaxID=2897299 RepID=UPI001F0485DB|nr:copper homeostasis protein cutC homolog isoform X1 [Xenia sp. Carnegie-2017]XP_046856026.1 copper homeostasis protein cutC homolog isoform X1 [Xenia sp. Carnegie-2017]XP_046856034.1 copper homeostasis protein cutC homolog isoform X1 [Xenia sp. Carnegie-2017]
MEVCVDSVRSAINAEIGGAKRIELCTDLLEGGVSPSVGLLKVVKRKVSLPVFVMIRPRGGDFFYSETEFEVMIEDCKQLINAGADGIVFGILDRHGKIDVKCCQYIIDLVKPLPVTFHRAFDMVPDQSVALESLINIGCSRVLTSGARPTAVEGLHSIKNLVQQARERILIMPGGGINEDNLLEILKSTGAKEFHGSAKVWVPSQMQFKNTLVHIGTSMEEYGHMEASLEKIRRLTKIANVLS